MIGQSLARSQAIHLQHESLQPYLSCSVSQQLHHIVELHFVDGDGSDREQAVPNFNLLICHTRTRSQRGKESEKYNIQFDRKTEKTGRSARVRTAPLLAADDDGVTAATTTPATLGPMASSRTNLNRHRVSDRQT
jgi:hypothetical protein